MYRSQLLRHQAHRRQHVAMARGFANSSTNTDWLAPDVWTLDVIFFLIGLDGPRHMCAPHQGARKSQAKYLKITEHTKHTPVDPGRTLL